MERRVADILGSAHLVDKNSLRAATWPFYQTLTSVLGIVGERFPVQRSGSCQQHNYLGSRRGQRAIPKVLYTARSRCILPTAS